MREALARARDLGAEAVRWFLLCDGRGALADATGASPTLHPRVLDDMDAAVRGLEDHGLGGLFVLIDFGWCARPRRLRGVTMGGRGALISDAARRSDLVDRVFRPVLERHGASRGVLGWDVINEPEWATSIPRDAMRALIAETVDLSHAVSDKPVTVGLASTAGLPLVRDLGLDVYQAHWYDKLERRAPLDAPVERLGLDRPLLLGEFPTRGSRRRPQEIVAIAQARGYCGALAWSLLAEDSASDGLAVGI